MRRQTMTPAVIYARISTDKQDARSIDDQFRKCREFAAREGYEVVGEFSDEAVSGAHTDRPGLRRMLDVATATRRSPFEVVVVDDLSRLSRDIGDTHRIIYDVLAGAGVRVVDTSGLDSESDAGEMTIAMRSIINREYIKGVAKQTRRGMQGRALAGFWTGGRVYGYTTVPEPNPPDPAHPRKVPVVSDAEATVVRRVFQMFIDGKGLKAIAEHLNRDGVPAPHDGGRGHKGARGWVHSTIRNVLRNERYVGRWAWNTHRWFQVSVGGDKRWRRTPNPRTEHVVRDVPQLALVDSATWGKVQEKLRAQTRGRGRPAGTGRHVYLTSGLLRCGTCGGSMSVVGQRNKDGVRYVTFGCTTNRSRGGAVCDNALTISEKRVTSALVGSLRELFEAPDVVRRLTAGIASRVERLTRSTGAKATAAQIADAEARVRQLAENLALIPASAAMLEKLADEERRLVELKASRRASAPSVRAPSEAQVCGYLADLVGTLEGDAVAGRQMLGEILAPVVCTPSEAPRGYRCRTELRLPADLGPSSRTGSAGKCGSGGPQPDFPAPSEVVEFFVASLRAA